MEDDSENSQVLGGTAYRELQDKSGELPQLWGGPHQAAFVDPEWLKDNLNATLDTNFGSPVKQGTSKVITSPVSTLDACWSPNAAASGPPMKSLKIT